MKYVVVGAGGIGTQLLPSLCRFLDSTGNNCYILVLDGDSYEPKNVDRQHFSRYGNKAEVSAQTLAPLFSNITIECRPVFVSEENAFLFVEEGDVVFACVDNHATRRILSRHCESLQNVTLISGGNDYANGSVQVFLRRSGRNVTPPLTYLHPEIESPKDAHPEEMSCEELVEAGSPQLIFTNLTAAALMLNAFWMVESNQTLPYTEVYFDLTTGAQRSVKREEKTYEFDF